MDNGRLFIWNFRPDTMNSCNIVVFSLGYLLQTEVDCFVNLAVCRLAVYYLNVVQNARGCPRKVLEKSLKLSLKVLEF